MKLTLLKAKQGLQAHQDTVTCLGWTSNNELYSCSDDHQIQKWNHSGELLASVCNLPTDTFPTDMQWLPCSSSKKSSTPEFMLVGASDGKYHLLSRVGRIEKTVEAHRGSVLSVKWSGDGSAILTAGEDGQVKVWSKSGMLRSVLAQSANPVYDVAWGADAETILYTNDKQLIIKPLQPSAKPTAWKAHDGVVLVIDWSRINNRIISGGEDRRYKVWDSYGRSLFSSGPFDSPITALSWSPDGELFAAGSFSSLRLCDQIGWSYSLEKPESGTILKLSWTSDGTQLAAAGANGSVWFARLVEKKLVWKNIDAVVVESNRILVKDVLTTARENLEFRDPIIKTSLNFGYLIVATSSQCIIYSVKNWNTPAIFDLKNGTVGLILQTEKHFLLVDTFLGPQIFTYDGRLISSPTFAGLQPEFMDAVTTSISNDSIAIRDRTNQKLVHVLDIISGKEYPNSPLKHTHEIHQLCLDQPGANSLARHLAIVDKNNELYIGKVRLVNASTTNSSTNPNANFYKLGTMVDSVAWSDCTGMLVALLDGKFSVWYCPAAAYIDADMVSLTRVDRNGGDFGKNPHIVSFVGNYVTIRRADGAQIVTTVSPHPALLHEYTFTKRWAEALRLCRFVKDKQLWASLAVMAIDEKELNTAEAAFAELHDAAKVEYIKSIKEIPTPEGRNAEMALFRRQPLEAEYILLQAGLVYSSIKMNINLFNWDRALDLAIKHKTHVDTVLGFRANYLQTCNRTETDARFAEYAKEVVVDWEKINAKIEVEKQKEKERPGAAPYR
eukprot:Sdes_comp15780_c0_seq1m4841